MLYHIATINMKRFFPQIIAGLKQINTELPLAIRKETQIQVDWKVKLWKRLHLKKENNA